MIYEDPSQRATPTMRHAVDPRGGLGRLGEDLARRYFEGLGFRTLACNEDMRVGELDLIVARSPVLVFVEVKTRRVVRGYARQGGAEFGPWGWPRGAQRRRQRLAAAEWLRTSEQGRPWLPDVRFDAVRVAVDGNDALASLEHVQGI